MNKTILYIVRTEQQASEPAMNEASMHVPFSLLSITKWSL